MAQEDKVNQKNDVMDLCQDMKGSATETVLASGRIYDVEEMRKRLEGFFLGARMPEALRAMDYMIKKHKKRKRDGGQPYATHPLAMATMAMHFYSMGVKLISETTFIVILLHDVCEEEGNMVEELPFDGEARHGVKYMTITRFKHDSKFTEKVRYAMELLESRDAVIAKLFDVLHNLSTMVNVFPDEKIRKNVVDKDQIFLPVFDQAAEKYRDAYGLISLMTLMIRMLNDILASHYRVKLTDSGFLNSQEAQDYSRLIQ